VAQVEDVEAIVEGEGPVGSCLWGKGVGTLFRST
jgi:hypothetical protein